MQLVVKKLLLSRVLATRGLATISYKLMGATTWTLLSDNAVILPGGNLQTPLTFAVAVNQVYQVKAAINGCPDSEQIQTILAPQASTTPAPTTTPAPATTTTAATTTAAPTTTAVPTTLPACTLYTVNSLTNVAGQIVSGTYIPCGQSAPVMFSLQPLQTASFCAVTGSVQGTGFALTAGGACTTAAPTTAAPTTTAAPSSCTAYRIQNLTANRIPFSYKVCGVDVYPRAMALPGFDLTICVQTGSLSGGAGLTITPGLACSTVDPTSPIYYGGRDTNALPTVQQIEAGTMQRIRQGGEALPNYSTLTAPKFLWMAEPVSEPVKTVWYEAQNNQGAIGGTAGSTENLFAAPVVIGSYRFYQTEYPTEVVNPVFELIPQV